MTTFVTRAQWGARPRKTGTTSIVDHPSVTFHYVGGGWEFPWDHSSCDDKVRGIQVDHMDNRDWSDIGYNYLVCPHNYCYEGRGYDRRSSANGSDSANNASFAVCALWGAASADDPLPLGLKRAFHFARSILQRFGGATTIVKGHRDWKPTTCPGDQIYAWIQAGIPLPSVGEPDMTTDASVRAIVKEEIRAACVDGGPIHETVQIYAAFVAKHSDQLVDDTGSYAGKVTDVLLKNDFELLTTEVHEVKGQLENITSKLEQLLTKQ